MEITKALCLSTSHITQQTENWLRCTHNANDGPISIWEGPHGYFVPVYAIKETGGAGLPGDLIDCMERAVTYDCEFLRLDCDGPVMEGLQTYDW